MKIPLTYTPANKHKYNSSKALHYGQQVSRITIVDIKLVVVLPNIRFTQTKLLAFDLCKRSNSWILDILSKKTVVTANRLDTCRVLARLVGVKGQLHYPEN